MKLGDHGELFGDRWGTVESNGQWRAHGRELAVEHRDPCSGRLCCRVAHSFFTGLAGTVQAG